MAANTKNAFDDCTAPIQQGEMWYRYREKALHSQMVKIDLLKEAESEWSSEIHINELEILEERNLWRGNRSSMRRVSSEGEEFLQPENLINREQFKDRDTWKWWQTEHAFGIRTVIDGRSYLMIPISEGIYGEVVWDSSIPDRLIAPDWLNDTDNKEWKWSLNGVRLSRLVILSFRV